MGRRGRRQVLQLNDVSSSHQPRRYVFQPQQEEDRRPQAGAVNNPLLNLVGDYNSDSGEEDEEQNNQQQVAREKDKKEEYAATPPYVDNHARGQTTEKPAPQEGGSLDSEVANFLAEIESISTDPAPNADNGQTSEADSSIPPKADVGFMIKPDASVPSKAEELQKKAKSASGNAYKSMFVKGESEFVRPEDKENGKGGKTDEDGEELPEEPVSEWQVVQDEATQYYYYWNMVTNEVTWEIPQGYTQFLLRYKEYEEKIAKIPADKLKRLKEKAEKKMREQLPGGAPRVSEPSVTSHQDSVSKDSSSRPTSEHKSKSSKHSKHPETNGSSRHSSSSREKKKKKELVEYGPSLPPPELRVSEADQMSEKLHQNGNGKSVTNAKSELADLSAELKTNITDTVSTVGPSLPVEKPNSVPSEKPPSPKSAHVHSVTADDVIKEVLMGAEMLPELNTESETLDGQKLVTEPVLEMGTEPAGEMVTEPVVKNKEEQVQETEAKEEEEEDFDMDFDDIDDLDRALEKALEKKLEKKKAELLKLEEKDKAPVTQEASPEPPLLPNTAPTMKAPSKLEQEETAQADHKSEEALNSAQSHEVVKESASESLIPQPEIVEDDVADSMEEVKAEGKIPFHEPQAVKRTAEDAAVVPDQEPDEKKARLVAYDLPESDEENLDTSGSEAVMPAPDQVHRVLSDGDMSNVLPTPPPERVDNLAELQSMAEIALDKLAFLEVTTKGLSPLQITLIQLQTRLKDWQEGGLNAQYFYQRMSEVNGLLEQYENKAVPPGWACHWDRNFRRYFYTHTETGESQWDYPDMTEPSTSATDAKEDPTASKKRSKGSKKGRKRKVKVTEDALEAKEPHTEDLCEEPEVSQGAETEDLDGVAVSEEDTTQLQEQQQETGSPETAPPAPDIPATETESAQPAAQPFFPGEPLPPGTELLFGLPPPPPPSYPPPDEQPASGDYVCDEDDFYSERVDEDIDETSDKPGPSFQSFETTEKRGHVDHGGEEREQFEPEDMEVSQGGDSRSEGSLEMHEPPAEPGVIAKPPQLRFPVHNSTSSSSLWAQGVSGEGSHPTGSDSAVLSAAPVLSAFASVKAEMDSVLSGNEGSAPASPRTEDGISSRGSPAPADPPNAADHKHEKHKKKKKEKLGSSGLALKKKGVSSLVQKWQKVKREVEQEERANERRQMAIRQQLEEWKKENN